MSYKVIIIGAGASGLMAARMLAEKNHSVMVVEARNRIGGRIHTLRGGFSQPMEAGAEFIHGRQPLTLSLIKESKNKATLVSGNWYQLWDGQLQNRDFFGAGWGQVTKALEKLETDVDMGTFLNRHFGANAYQDLRQRVKGFVEGYDAADLDRVSAMALREEWAESDDGHQFRVQGGYARLMHYLEEKIKGRGGELLLSSPVKEIYWSEGKVKVVTETNRVLEGEKVIITVPLGVLQKGMITFNPYLPQAITAIEEMGFGGVIKFFFEFKQAFWENQPNPRLKNLAFVFSDAEIPTWWSQLPEKTPVLTGWLGGPSTYQFHDVQELLYDKAVRSLAYLLNCSATDIQEGIREWHIENWVTDPHTFGAYAYPTTGTRNARDFLRIPVKDTVYFAGEAMYQGAAIGTVEAALVSGREVAEKIMG